jgi:hypothetical protein
MTTYRAGTLVFCDFAFGGKPKGKAIEVIEPGQGNRVEGKIKVQLTETVGAYKKGEILELKAHVAVPRKQEFHKPGSVFRWVNGLYQWS